MTYVEAFLYCCSLLLVLAYFAIALRRSEFGLIILTYDLPFFLGCCLYPLLLGAAIIPPGIEARVALSSIGMPGTLTAVHILAVSGGMLLGYAAGRNASAPQFHPWQRFAEFLVPETVIAWRVLIVAGLVVITTFMLLVGVEVALVNAALARAGAFEGFQEDLEWLFLKRLASIFGLVFVFVPAVLMLKKERPIYWIAYLLLVALLYLNSISRVLLIRTLVLPTVVYLYMSGKLLRPRTVLLLPVIALFVAFVVVYGKAFGPLAGAFFADESFELVGWQTDEGIAGAFVALLQNMEGRWFSIAGGIRHFAENGPLIPPDVVAAVIGFIPSRVLDWAGFGAFHYSTIEPRLACLNTAILGIDGCFLPPFTEGYSAYLAPIAGGFVVAFVKTWLFGRLEAMWIAFRATSVSLLWLPFLVLHLVSLIFSFIPVNISIAAFVVLVIAGYWLLKLAAERLPSLRSA